MGTPVFMEPILKYQPGNIWILTPCRYPGGGQCVVGSLTGAVASQNVTEARKGYLSVFGNHATSAMA